MVVKQCGKGFSDSNSSGCAKCLAKAEPTEQEGLHFSSTGAAYFSATICGKLYS